MAIGFEGRWNIEQYNAIKPKKHHIKIFRFCDSAVGCGSNLLTYFVKDTNYKALSDETSDQAEKNFNTLLDEIEPGHRVLLIGTTQHVNW